MSDTAHHVSLKPTEQALLTAASTIFAAYVASGRVAKGEESDWQKQSIRDAIRMGKIIDAAVRADGELA